MVRFRVEKETDRKAHLRISADSESLSAGQTEIFFMSVALNL